MSTKLLLSQDFGNVYINLHGIRDFWINDRDRSVFYVDAMLSHNRHMHCREDQGEVLRAVGTLRYAARRAQLDRLSSSGVNKC